MRIRSVPPERHSATSESQNPPQVLPSSDKIGGCGRARFAICRRKTPTGATLTIRSLPYFFGQEGGIAECARAVRSQAGLVAADDSGKIVGFLTHESYYPGSAEITWMAVRHDVRRIGVGRRLITRLADDASADGIHMLFVITLGPSVPEPDVTDGYGGTRAFDERTGFVPLKELDCWGPDSQGLVLARSV